MIGHEAGKVGGNYKRGVKQVMENEIDKRSERNKGMGSENRKGKFRKVIMVCSGK